MKILIGEDDRVFRAILTKTLQRWNYEVLTAEDGAQAVALFKAESPCMVILDWEMPNMTGIEACREMRAIHPDQPLYVILLTSRTEEEDMVTALDEGADDFITKPLKQNELNARLRAGVRIVELQKRLSGRVKELEEALSQVKQLSGLLPICAWCKRIRDDRNYWSQVDTYLDEHTDLEFSHAICPTCLERIENGENPTIH